MRSGGSWLFWISALYIVAGIINWNSNPCIRLEYIQAAYVLVLSLPLWVRPLARKLNMKCVWEA